jgi:hypothetical protein
MSIRPFLEREGPSAKSSLPEHSQSYSDEIKSFSVKAHANRHVFTWVGGEDWIYYLPEHSKEAVIEEWLESNPKLREKKSNWALFQLIERQGDEWEEAAREVIDYNPDLKNVENAKSDGNVCPRCGKEIDGMLYTHLPDCGSEAVEQ